MALCDVHDSERCRNDTDHKELWDKIDELERRIEDHDKKQAVSDEKISMIFEILSEIKTSVKDIADRFDKKTNDEMNEIKEKNKISYGAIITGAIQLIVTLILAGLVAYKG